MKINYNLILSKKFLILSSFTLTTLLIEPKISHSAVMLKDTYTTIDFSEDFNSNLQERLVAPESFVGDLILEGVPFSIPMTDLNFWSSLELSDPNPRTLEIDIDTFGVTEVHTLINSFWGEPGPNSFASLEFFGSDGAFFRKDLIGSDDIRDYNFASFTNNINNTTTLNILSWQAFGVGQRLDKQQIFLPDDFKDETLTLIRLSDNGNTNFQRVFLAGITVKSKSVPEPYSPFSLVAVALGGTALFFNSKLNKN